MQINIEKRHILIILGMMFLLAGGLVYAFGGSEPSVMGHSANEIDWSERIDSNIKLDGQNLSLSGTGWSSDGWIKGAYLSQHDCSWKSSSGEVICDNGYYMAGYKSEAFKNKIYCCRF